MAPLFDDKLKQNVSFCPENALEKTRNRIIMTYLQKRNAYLNVEDIKVVYNFNYWLKSSVINIGRQEIFLNNTISNAKSK